MSPAWLAAGAAALLVGVAALFERRRAVRTDPDRVGMVDWPMVQMLSLIVLAIAVSVAMHA